MSQNNPTDVQANKYAEIYVLYGVKTDAWKNAFPDSKAKIDHVYTSASLFHDIPKVQQRVEEIRSKLQKQTEEEFSITVSDLKKMLVEAAMGGLKTKVDAQANEVPINISGAVSAISEINRMDGNHSPLKTQEIKANELTPWDSVKAGVDENEKDN